VDVVVGTYPDRHFAAGSFDAVTMWNSLEHMYDPLGVLESAAAVLAPGGSVTVSLPNFASYGARHFRENWFPLDLPRHLNHFTPESLKRAFERAGLVFEDLRQLRRTSSLRRSARYARRAGDGRLSTRLMTTRLGAGVAARYRAWRGECDLMIAAARKARASGGTRS
jgi:SAM-dependent methyltransferase